MRAPSENIRVLHVDDEPGFSELAAEFLERQDDRFDIDTTTSASEGLDWLAETTVDCVVSDFDMPGRNGIEFLEAVREDYPDLPFILYTGKGSEEVASEAISAGVTDYLQKEAGTEQYAVLANRITNVVDQYHARRQTTKLTRRLEAILENTTTPMFLKDDKGVYLLVNQGFVALFGLADESEIVGHTDHDLLPENDISSILAHDRLVFASGESIEVEERVPVDGDERIFLSSKVPIYDIGTRSNEDAPVALFGVSRDITTLKTRERELERHRDLLEHTERLAGTGGWEADVQTGRQRWTDGTYAIHELDPEGDYDPTVDAGVSFFHPDDQPAIEQAVERCMDHGEPYEVELRLISAEDNLRWVRASGAAIEKDGEVVKIRGAIQDITDRKNRE